jgi:hypothetical protein
MEGKDRGWGQCRPQRLKIGWLKLANLKLLEPATVVKVSQS